MNDGFAEFLHLSWHNVHRIGSILIRFLAESWHV